MSESSPLAPKLDPAPKPDPADHGARMRERLRARQLSSLQDQLRSLQEDRYLYGGRLWQEDPGEALIQTSLHGTTNEIQAIRQRLARSQSRKSSGSGSPKSVGASRLILWIILAAIITVAVARAKMGAHWRKKS